MERMSVFVFDLDGTLCDTEGSDYPNAQSRPERIAFVNRLYNEGHRVVIDSARGSTTGKDWSALTLRQLREWGVRFHKCRTGVKFSGDVYIDDKAMTDDAFFSHRYHHKDSSTVDS